MDTDIHSAIKLNKLAEFNKALENDANSLDATNENGDTVLHSACDFQNAGMVEIILAKKPNMVWDRNGKGETPIHTACKNGNLQILKMLMEYHDIHLVATKVDNLGNTPLMVCIDRYHYHLVKYLLQYYPWMPGSDQNGIMCLRTAIFKAPQDVKMVRLLVEARPNLVEKRDNEGNTALHLAVSKKCYQVAEFLINYMAVNVDARNKEGHTALDIYIATVPLWRRDTRHIHQLLVENSNPWEFGAYFGAIKVQGDGIEEVTISEEEEEEEEEPGHTGNNVNFLKQQHKETQKAIWRTLQKKKIYEEALQNARNTVVIVAVLIATVAFQAAMSPPGGVYQDGPYIGQSMLATTTAFKVFMVTNTAGFAISLGIVVVFVSFIPIKRKSLVRIIRYSHRAMCTAVLFLTAAFIAASWATLPSYPHNKVDETKWIRVVLVVMAGGGLGVVFLVWGVMLGKHLKIKSNWRRTRILDSKHKVNCFGKKRKTAGSARSQLDDPAMISTSSNIATYEGTEKGIVPI